MDETAKKIIADSTIMFEQVMVLSVVSTTDAHTHQTRSTDSGVCDIVHLIHKTNMGLAIRSLAKSMTKCT